MRYCLIDNLQPNQPDSWVDTGAMVISHESRPSPLTHAGTHLNHAGTHGKEISGVPHIARRAKSNHSLVVSGTPRSVLHRLNHATISPAHGRRLSYPTR